MIHKEFLRQLKNVERISAGTSGILKPKTMHRLRSAILRLAILLKYTRNGKAVNVGRRLMKFRRATAYRRDCDVCWSRIRNELHTSGLGKKARRRIKRSIDAQKRKAQREMEHKLMARKFRKLLLSIHDHIDDLGKIDVNAVHHENIIYQSPNQWEPGQFHQIRKRLRIINYVHDLLLGKEETEDQKDNDNWILRYQNVLGDYIDGSNTVGILRRLKKVKRSQIERLINKETAKMQKCRWLIKSMPWPDTVSFSRTAFQESYL